MPTADMLARLGLFVVRGFFDAETTASLLAEARSASRRPATVGVTGGSAYVVDETVRRTKWAEVSAEASSLVEGRLLGLKPDLERHFGSSLVDCQVPQFLVYRPGDFFQVHRDSRRDPDAAERSRERKVAVVAFLNGESDEPREDTYGGGSLTFYGLIGDARTDKLGLPLIGEPGLLIGFRPDVLHEVTAVTHGERYTIVSWFR